ncbi:transposase family protein [Halobacteroides halobius DSM 5150]|uniref:Transposase family protein n=1 Tax=Halobacteroides halobius (strain ATCC 35273 / DSM 5150 / MD-1) TaxID=748449 RepID=L0K799_HALHC|nr:IS701 family transposase [Halobacteroides halobius]AGB40410.1 transposase family protein [Halobacteroides halobius DSM 5150]
MSNNFILPDNKLIDKFFDENNFNLYYSKPALKHIKEFILAGISKRFSSKTTDIAEYSENHRTTIGHFLSKGNWNEEFIKEIIKNQSLEFSFDYAKNNDEPIFILHDDTVSEKTNPSSQAKSPIEKTDFCYSHLTGRTVLGHQLLTTMIQSGEHNLVYDLQRYDREGKSKIDTVCDIAESMPTPPTNAYALFDSWYNCPKIINAYAKKGYHCIGALKRNRIIYPKGIRIGISDYAKYIQKSDVHLVTVNGSEYWVHRYEGNLNNIENAVVILSWPVDAFKNSKALRAFLCTNVSLDEKTILEYYSKRWSIEVYFRQSKSILGLDKYQVRSIKAIDRIWVLQNLVYLFCTIGLDKPMKFGRGVLEARKHSKREYIEWIYECAQTGIPLNTTLELLNVA